MICKKRVFFINGCNNHEALQKDYRYENYPISLRNAKNQAMTIKCKNIHYTYRGMMKTKNDLEYNIIVPIIIKCT